MCNVMIDKMISSSIKLLLISNSTNVGEAYLAYPQAQIGDFLQGITRVAFVPYAAVTFSYEAYEAKVQEIVYLDSRALRQLLAYVSRTARSVQVTVSDDEQLERIFPQAIPHREDHLMARLNSPALFNKLYNTKAHHAKDAFDLLKKPMWNHSR